MELSSKYYIKYEKPIRFYQLEIGDFYCYSNPQKNILMKKEEHTAQNMKSGNIYAVSPNRLVYRLERKEDE